VLRNRDERATRITRPMARATMSSVKVMPAWREEKVEGGIGFGSGAVEQGDGHTGGYCAPVPVVPILVFAAGISRRDGMVQALPGNADLIDARGADSRRQV